MAIVIHHDNVHKPKNCANCPFNYYDCWCSITHGEIDRDYWDCSIPCPIEEMIE